jgi:acyl-CoA synthetase (NDP forming)/GNAT superfamily N-acetyltransferase
METEIDRADAYALLTDGRCVHVRSVTPDDWQAVYDFAATLGQQSLYRRFYTVPSHPGETLADVLCSPRVEQNPPTQGALIALLDGTPVGVAEWYRTRGQDEAEIAFEVSDVLHGHGVATLLVEHLMLAARRAGIRRLTAVTVGENQPMADVFVGLHVPVGRSWDHGECTWSIPLDHVALDGEPALEAMARRESVADEASLRHLFAPTAIAVCGAQDDPTAAMVLRNLEGFDGTVTRGGACGELLTADVGADLAVVTSPPEDAVAAARRCAGIGVKALIATAVGFPPALGRELLRVCHESGMRIVGPGSLGVASLHGAHRFSALLSGFVPEPGDAGAAVQSGGVGLAMLSHLRRLGIGVSTFAAVGEKYDVSANDVLMRWERDERTRFGLLHVESFGNPRKFARTARRVSRRIPLLAVDPEQAPSQARTALYAQAGIIALPSLGALVNAAALAEHQPLPSGPRVAVVGTTHGMVTLSVQACVKAGLDVAESVNLTPAADGTALEDAVVRIAAKGTAAAVLVAVAPTVPHELDPLIAASAVRSVSAETVVLAVRTDQPESVTVLGSDVRMPSYDDAAAAAQALAALARAHEVMVRPAYEATAPEGADPGAAESLIEDWLRDAPLGRELDPAECARLLGAVGVPVGTAGARPSIVTVWQDPVFGPLLSADARDGREAMTVLVPFDAADSAAVAAYVHVGEDLLSRLSALLEACPELAALRLELGGGSVVPTSGAVAPAPNESPYLRRLRRAPVE